MLVTYSYEIAMKHLYLYLWFFRLGLTSLSISVDGRLQPTPTYISKCFFWRTDNLYGPSVSQFTLTDLCIMALLLLETVAGLKVRLEGDKLQLTC